MAVLEEEIGDLLREQGLTLGIVESATGGLIAEMVTSVAGSSDYFHGSITAYHNGIKTGLVGVKAETLRRYGAVSPQVAEEMAGGGREVLAVDICLADTGIAGPGGALPEKPVGLFYLGLAHRGGVSSREHVFSGSRAQNRQSAAEAALRWLREHLLGLKTGT